jgi:uncharacterized cupin superfamily protein
MTIDSPPIAVNAKDVPNRIVASVYPKVFVSKFEGRSKKQLGNLFGLSNFGVNLTTLQPGAISSLRHVHKTQDEFVYILEGVATLLTNAGKTKLSPGMCAGFKANNGDAHQLINESDGPVTYLEIGDRSPGDAASYPDDDIQAVLNSNGQWEFTHKDGSKYD